MSYASAKQRYAEKTTGFEDQPVSHNCFANGCPMAGGISTGGNWVCAYHHQATSDTWPRVTEALRDAEMVRVAINEVMKIDMISWGASVNGYPPKWQEFAALFDNEPELQPNEHEKIRKTKYEYRLRNELAIRAGLAKEEIMNPKVADMASKVGFDAADYTWFDFSELGDHADEELKSVGRQYGWHNQMMHLDEFLTPSDHMAVIQPAWPDIAFTYDKYIKFGGYEGAAVMLWTNDGFESPLAIVTEKRVHVVGAEDDEDGTNVVIHQKLMEASKRNGMTEPDAMKLYEDACISAVNYACLINLRAHTTEQVVTAHMAKGMEFINRKRRAKHQPLVYSWNTIELKPDAQVKQPHKGGTHASPARHKRRAHMRRLSAGGFTWIPEMWVGSIENGLIVHDYVADRELKGQG